VRSVLLPLTGGRLGEEEEKNKEVKIHFNSYKIFSESLCDARRAPADRKPEKNRELLTKKLS